MEVPVQNDIIERGNAILEACRSLRERQLENRLELQRKAQASARPLYVLKNKKQLELRLQ
jgi:flagellar biosynthesis/type III secretory pathway chaperone